MIPSALLTDTVVFEDYEGEGAYGGVFAAPRSVRCIADAMTRLVVNDKGEQVVSQLTLRVRPGDEAAPESQVTYGDRVSRVIAVRTRKAAGRAFCAEVVCS